MKRKMKKVNYITWDFDAYGGTITLWHIDSKMTRHAIASFHEMSGSAPISLPPTPIKHPRKRKKV